jgi:hypothetical protein
MTKALIPISSTFLFAGVFAWLLSASVAKYNPSNPTAPIPPRATSTHTRLPPHRSTRTPTRLPGTGWQSRTPTSSPSATLPATPTITNTITPTRTITPTLTQSPTQTPFLNLQVVVYLDMNQDKLFELGEGVNDLFLLVSSGKFTMQAILQNGEVWLALPSELLPGNDVQIQVPYLHWSDILHAPKMGDVIKASLRLDIPQYPVSLP